MKGLKFPLYLTDKNELIGTLIFTVLFAIVFLNIYIPTSATAWFELGKSIYFFMSVGFISLSALILVVSRIIMYRTRLFTKMNFTKYFIWIFIEIILLTLFYTIVTFTLIERESFNFISISLKSISVVSIILIIPYTIASIYCILNNKNKTLQLFHYIKEETISDSGSPLTDSDLIHLSDNNGNIKLSVKLENLYYIESQDNYIKIYYLNNDSMQNYMLRCKLKTIEDSFANSPLTRCHRSYIVNTNRIRIIRKEKEGVFIDMDWDGISPIPVSKGYMKNITSLNHQRL